MTDAAEPFPLYSLLQVDRKTGIITIDPQAGVKAERLRCLRVIEDWKTRGAPVEDLISKIKSGWEPF